MTDRKYDLAAVVEAHRAACVERGGWRRLTDMEYDAIAGTVLRDNHRGAVEDRMNVMGQKVDPFDVIEYHLSNVRRLWNGEPVRDLAESEAGYLAAMQHLRGVVGIIETARQELRDAIADGNPQILREYAEDAVEAMSAYLDRPRGQS